MSNKKGGGKNGHKQKLLVNVIMIVIGVVILVAALLTTVANNAVRKTYNRLIIEELKATSEHLASETGRLEDGADFTYVDDRIIKGEGDVTDEISDMIDKLHAQTGIDYTIFYGDTRILTTIYKAGTNERLIGTKASDAVIKTTLNGKQDFSSTTLKIEGMPYYGYYMER